MRKQLVVLATIAASFVACTTSKSGKLAFQNPDSGTGVVGGEKLKLTLNFPSAAIDSVVYSVDGEVFERKTDTVSVSLDTQKLAFGSRDISAKVYAAGKEEIAYSNIIVLPESAKNYGFEVLNTFPHDENAFTQGLQYVDGFLYESTGLYKESSLRKVDLNTGKVLQKINLPDDVFGEGMTIVGNQIALLTWQNNRGMLFNKNTFENIGGFDYQNSKEGWGLTYDGKQYIKTDGSNNLYFLDKDSFVEKSMVAVYDEHGPVNELNELEYIDGKVYANVYQKDIIVIINPETGAVEGRINLLGLYDHPAEEHELNGIAYDEAKKRLFVTGKKWPHIYEIKLIAR